MTPIYRSADFKRAVDRYAAATAERILKSELALEVRTVLNERRVRAARSATRRLLRTVSNRDLARNSPRDAERRTARLAL